MKSLLFNKIPAWYNILWSPVDRCFHIKIHEEVIPQLVVLKKEMPLIKGIESEFGFGGELFDTFCGDISLKRFGFNEKIQFFSHHGKFLDFVLKLPMVRNQSQETCEHCGGTGKNENFGSGECIRCDGTGKRVEYDWRKADLINVNLALLLFILDAPPEKDTSSPQNQLATAQLGWSRGRHLVAGYLSLEAFQIMRNNGEEFSLVAKRAMVQAHSIIMAKKEDHCNFGARIDENFHLQCPGDACGIYTTNGGDADNDSGYFALEYHCHNVDSSLQSLTLLAGLASILGVISEGRS